MYHLAGAAGAAPPGPFCSSLPVTDWRSKNPTIICHQYFWKNVFSASSTGAPSGTYPGAPPAALAAAYYF